MKKTLSLLEQARKLLGERRFTEVLTLLENKVFDYEYSFDFYYILGVACLYLGDSGGAKSWFEGAWRLREKDISLNNAQAALYLRRGDTDKALDCYLLVQDLDPQNKLAHRGLEFIRKKGDPEVIRQWVESGRIRRFYPPLGPNPLWLKLAGAGAALCALIAAVLLTVFYSEKKGDDQKNTAAHEALALSPSERSAAVQASDAASLVLSNDEAASAYDAARRYFLEGRDNAAQVEINRILNSNASDTLKSRAREMAATFEPPGFDSLKDEFGYAQVAGSPWLYKDCWVAWSGRVTNIKEEGGSMSCDLLVGYETMQRVEGIVRVQFETAPAIAPQDPVRILAQVEAEGGSLRLKGRAVFQPLPQG